MIETTHVAPGCSIALEAKVSSWVRLGQRCVVHPFAFLGCLPSTHSSLARKGEVVRELVLGRNVEVRPGAIVYGGVMIGDDCLIGDGANIREGVTLGERCIIGVGVSVLYDAQIGNDVRIMGGSQITGGMVIGDGTFVGVNVTTCNDRRRSMVDYEYVGANPPVIGRRCLIGSGACIGAGVTIGDGAVIGAGALVVRDVPEGATVMSEPGQVWERRAELVL